MPHTKETQLAGIFLQPKCISYTKIRVTHDAKHRIDTPIGHCLGHHVADRANVLDCFLDTDVNAIVSRFVLVHRHVIRMGILRLPCVRIEKPDSVVAVGINLPMEHAVYDATANLMEWLEEDYGVPPRDLYVRMSCDPAFRIRTYQMVRLATLQHVAGAEYPKERLFNAVKPKRKSVAKKPARKKK